MSAGVHVTDQFHLEPGGLQGLSGIHDDVVVGLGQLAESPGAGLTSVQTSHGSIAGPVTSALSGVADTRLGALATASTSSQTISELLQLARQRYDDGDREGAERLEAAAEQLAGAEQPGVPGAQPAAGTGPSAVGAAGGSDQAGQAGQLAGQVGQQVGQLASTMAQAVQGLAQGLTQLPQQIMQGVQGAMQSAGQADDTSEGKNHDERPDEDPDGADPDEDRERRERAADGTAPVQRAEDAQPGRSAEQGRAPTPIPPPDRPQPAQTRPQ